MGKSVVLHYEQFSSRYTNSGYICQLYELTKYGPKDLSAKIFGNMGGENLILSDNKVYFLTIIGTNSSGVAQYALSSSYSHIWNQHADKNISDIFLKSVYDRLLHHDVNTNWKKNPNARDSNDFVFKQTRFKEYASLIEDAVFCVSKPGSISEEEFAEYLEPYGGVENFDPRVFLYDEELLDECSYTMYGGHSAATREKQKEILTHLLTSRSYRLTSPIYITNSQIPGLLHCVHRTLKSGNENLEMPIATGTEIGSDTYRKISYSMNKKMRTILDPESFIRCSLKPPLSFLRNTNTLHPITKHINLCMVKGKNSNPEVYRLSTLTSNILNSAPYTTYLPKNSYPLHLEKILLGSQSLQGIEKAIWESAVRSANIIRTIYNSTSYLARDLSKTIELTLAPEVRWKGARKEKEIELCSYIFLLQCILKTPPLLKSMLSKNRYWGQYKKSTDSLLGHYLEALTGKPSIFSTREKTVNLHIDTFLSMQHDESEELNKRVRMYINFPTEDSYHKILEESVSCLERMLSSAGVASSIEHGIQITENGSLFRYNSLRIHTSCLAKKYTFPEDIMPSANSYLGDVYFIMSLNKKEYTINMNFYIDKVVKVIESILEIKGSVALKVAESYYLNGPLLKYLDPALWLNLHC